MTLRARLRPIQKTEIGSGDARQVTVRLTAATGPENQQWSPYTPSATLDIALKGGLADHLEIGRDYYVDIVEATD